MGWIIAGLIIVTLSFIGWCCLKVASDADDQMERVAAALESKHS